MVYEYEYEYDLDENKYTEKFLTDDFLRPPIAIQDFMENEMRKRCGMEWLEMKYFRNDELGTYSVGIIYPAEYDFEDVKKGFHHYVIFVYERLLKI